MQCAAAGRQLSSLVSTGTLDVLSIEFNTLSGNNWLQKATCYKRLTYFVDERELEQSRCQATVHVDYLTGEARGCAGSQVRDECGDHLSGSPALDGGLQSEDAHGG